MLLIHKTSAYDSVIDIKINYLLMNYLTTTRNESEEFMCPGSLKGYLSKSAFVCHCFSSLSSCPTVAQATVLR